jgi:rhodanese-related sulfurtransferase
MGDTITPDELRGLLAGPDPPRILDVRRRSDRDKDPLLIPGAEWKDPEKAEEWGRDLGSAAVVIYCVRGGSVSRSVLEKLREHNIDARYIEGGIEAWKGPRMQKSGP